MPRIEHRIIDTPESVAWKGPLSGTDHSVIRVPDLDVAIPWYQSMLGLVPTERRNDKIYLMGPVSGRIVLGLSEGGTGLDYVSFPARSAQSYDALATKLVANGIDTIFGVDTTREGARNELRVALSTGHVFEVAEHETNAPPAPVERTYRPGAIDIRNSHLPLRSSDVTGVPDFLGVLGYLSSLFVPLPDSPAYFIQFLRANAIHLQVTVLTGREGLHHVALEADEVDFLQTLDNLALTELVADYGTVRIRGQDAFHIRPGPVRKPDRGHLHYGDGRFRLRRTVQPIRHPWHHLNM
ncbi:bleomycin resistance protein [Microbacterium sp. LMI12-1-1.1]|uniref:VOC family protein n=1 Tax=Microbacterium sp. LMI12-1-1.1 TaxID=3135225 RepID=UPI00341DF33A